LVIYDVCWKPAIILFVDANYVYVKRNKRFNIYPVMDDESNPLLEIIQLIDSAIECDEYDEAFFFIHKICQNVIQCG